MSQCSDILLVLADGEWHTVAEIHRRAGFSRLNSRVSDLRSQGHDIECDHDGEGARATDRYRYRLRLLGETPASTASRTDSRAMQPLDTEAWGLAEQTENGQLYLAEVAA